ncbi:hypothetical protein LTR66_016302, partial [Elasticomyces elasticus]
VTRAEEKLIAAMRLKKIAMKRAEALAHRQGALKALEQDTQEHVVQKYRPISPRGYRLPHIASQSIDEGVQQRPRDTLLSDSGLGQSIPSNITHRTMPSEDQALNHSTLAGVKDGVPRRLELPPAIEATNDELEARQTSFLSNTTDSNIPDRVTAWCAGVHNNLLAAVDPEEKVSGSAAELESSPLSPHLGTWQVPRTLQTAH